MGSFGGICAPNLHVKEPKYGFEYILIKSPTCDKTTYKISVFDVEKLKLIENKDLSLDKYGFLSVGLEDVVRSLCGDNNDPRIGLEHVNAIRADNRIENIKFSINHYSHSDEMYSLPRFLKWHEYEKRFSFEEHPLVQITSMLAKKECVPFFVHDTLIPTAPSVQKLHDCILHMLLMFELALHACVDYKATYTDSYDEKQYQNLFTDYQSFMQFAHHYDARNFPKNECIMDCNPIIYEKEYCVKYLDHLCLICASKR